MERDIRETPLYREVHANFAAMFQMGSGRIGDADHVAAAPDARTFGFTGTVFADFNLPPRTRVCLVDAQTGNFRSLPGGKFNDRNPVWSPDGKWLAFLSDREEAGNFQLFLAQPDGTDPRAAPRVNGCVEYLSWSPDGSRVLLGVAGFGADLAGCQGGATIARKAAELPPWIPEIETGNAANLWRTLWVLDVAKGELLNASPAGINPWESAWLGNQALVAVVSDSHSEGSWYRSRLVRIELPSLKTSTLLQPTEQIGLPCCNPDGSQVAIAEAVCSDRMIVAGDLRLIDARDGRVTPIDTRGVDVTHLVWRNKKELVFTGLRGFETVIGEVDVHRGRVREVWSDAYRTMGVWYPSVAALSTGGVAALLESYEQAPTLTILGRGAEEELYALHPEGAGEVRHAEHFTWTGRDGLEMQGWLIRPDKNAGPAPLVVDIHGGPVWACRNRWMGRLRGAKTLADHGVVSLYPNPRGSGGRGQAFAALVRGDMGGEDTYDYLRGIDALVEQGIADPRRIGVTGISYGGFMSAWLIAQDQRFAAAVPISPTSNWYSQHRTSQIPYFDEFFLDASASEPGGKFFERSPVMFADRVACPTLTLAGAKDQNTPPTQALEFHRSLLEHGVTSVLVTYPTAGHGIRSFPEVIDHTTRYVEWFLRYLGEGKPAGDALR